MARRSRALASELSLDEWLLSFYDGCVYETVFKFCCDLKFRYSEAVLAN